MSYFVKKNDYFYLQVFFSSKYDYLNCPLTYAVTLDIEIFTLLFHLNISGAVGTNTSLIAFLKYLIS